jgi:hypothetical protein
MDKQSSLLFFLFLQRTVDGKNYWTFEYDLEAPGYGVSAFATVAIGNGTIFLPKQTKKNRNEQMISVSCFHLTEEENCRSILHAACDCERATVEQAAEQAQSGGGFFQDI